MKKKIIVLGAGISGLAAAWWLHKDGYDVTVLDKNREAGGVMESIIQDNSLFDRGPNSGLGNFSVDFRNGKRSRIKR